MKSLQTIISFLRKDLFLLTFGSGFILTGILMSLSLFLIFRVTLPLDQLDLNMTISILYASFMVSATFILFALQGWEWEMKSYRQVRLSGVEGSLAFAGKALAASIGLFLLWSIISAIWFFLLAGPAMPILTEASDLFAFWGALMLPGFLVSCGLAVAGVLAAAIAVQTRFREIFLFLIFFPMCLPGMISGSSASRLILNGKKISEVWSVLNLQVAFILIFIAAGLALYDLLLEE